MRKLRIAVVDLVTRNPNRSLWARIMFPNFANIMPQIVATWCEQEGHDVRLIVYTGVENLEHEIPENADLVFIGAFSHAAQLSYALSNMLRSRGAITVLGGPHARSYPQDAVKYFDYVVGFTDKTVIRDILSDCSRHRPVGMHLSADRHPDHLPGIQERWKYVEQTLNKAPLIKVIPMMGSLGCPYTCEFCVDSVVPYQPLAFDVIKEDLRFLLTKFEKPAVGWQDPNFGVRFDDYMEVIEDAVPPGRIAFFAESSLSLLSEDHLKQLKKNGFRAILPGIESWYSMGNKSKTGKRCGIEKVKQVADHINLILSYIPYLQANFVVGLDVDEGPEPFELTKRFVDLAPGAYPAYSMLSAFGQSAPLNIEYQRQGRVIPYPFHFMNTQHASNVRSKNYGIVEFFKYLRDLTEYTFSRKAIINRYRANRLSPMWRWINVLRAVTSQGKGRVKQHTEMIHRLENDRPFRAFFEQETTELPQYYVDRIRRDLGPFWHWLPEGALEHDPNAGLKSHEALERSGAELPKVAVAGTGRA